MRGNGGWKIVAVVIVFIFLLAMVGATPSAWAAPESDSSSAMIYVPDDYPTIEAAVDAASPGDTIIVRDGIYRENIVVDKRLTIKSENGSGNCIVEDKYDAVFEVTADYVNISGFTVKGVGRYGAGIYLYDADHCSISNNICSNNYRGIHLEYSSNNSISSNTFANDGLFVSDSYQNTVENNTVNNKPLVYLEDASDYKVGDAGQVILVSCRNITVENLNLSNTCVGIQLGDTTNSKILNNVLSDKNYGGISLLYSSNNNSISGNDVINNNDHGIYLYDSSNNSISGNDVSNNWRDGISLWYSSNNSISGNTFVNDGLFVSGSYQNTVENNTVNNKPLVYLEDASDYRVEDAGQVILVNCRNITAENLDLSNTTNGIQLWETEDSIIADNTINNNSGDGIILWDSSHNSIYGNDVSGNSDDGIYLRDSSNNKIYLNNFINNTDNAYGNSNNMWSSASSMIYIYNETTHTNNLGNYWSDYTGTDADNDGIGDKHYRINSDNNDEYPLMERFEYYFPTTQPGGDNKR